MAKPILIILSASLFFILGCKAPKANNSTEIRTLQGFRLSPLVDSLFKEYVKEIPGSPAYAICMDKKQEGSSMFTVTIAPFTQKVNDLYATGTPNYFMFHDTVPVLLYSGMEDFVCCDSPSFARAKTIPSTYTGEFRHTDPIGLQVDFTKGWSYVHLDTLSYVVKGDGFPFSLVPIS